MTNLIVDPNLVTFLLPKKGTNLAREAQKACQIYDQIGVQAEATILRDHNNKPIFAVIALKTNNLIRNFFKKPFELKSISPSLLRLNEDFLEIISKYYPDRIAENAGAAVVKNLKIKG